MSVTDPSLLERAAARLGASRGMPQLVLPHAELEDVVRHRQEFEFASKHGQETRDALIRCARRLHGHGRAVRGPRCEAVRACRAPPATVQHKKRESAQSSAS